MPPVLQPDWQGRRVVVRRFASPGPNPRANPSADPKFSDVLGDLVGMTADALTVATRTATVVIARDEVVSARLVRPSRVDIFALERASARGWRAREVTTNVDGWLLRADQGWTGRANSALALRTLQRPLGDVLAQLQAWYAERGLPARIQIPQPAGDALGLALGRLAWIAADPTDVLICRLDLLTDRVGDRVDGRVGVNVRFDPAPDVAWLSGYHYRGGAALPAGAAELLRRHDNVVFARVDGVDGPVAIARGAVDDGWLGITAVDVHPAHRRRGLAVAVVAALVHWGVETGANRAYVQTDETNRPAHTLFEAMGFYHHHSYHYRSAPTLD